MKSLRERNIRTHLIIYIIKSRQIKGLVQYLYNNQMGEWLNGQIQIIPAGSEKAAVCEIQLGFSIKKPVIV